MSLGTQCASATGSRRSCLGTLHGAAGNTLALLRHAANGRGRYSLWTGDVGTALFAAACLDADARYPIIDVV